jgi:hypothetical protein
MFMGQQKNPLLFMGQQKNPILFMGQQRNSLLFMGQQRNPLLFIGQQANPFRRRSHRFAFRRSILVSFLGWARDHGRVRFCTEGRGRVQSVESVDGGWDVWSAPLGPSGDKMAKKGECDYVKRGWEATGEVPLRPSGDCREIAGPVKENTLEFEGPGYDGNEFEGPGRGSRTTGRPGCDRGGFEGPGGGSSVTGRPGYEKFVTERPGHGYYLAPLLIFI